MRVAGMLAGLCGCSQLLDIHDFAPPGDAARDGTTVSDAPRDAAIDAPLACPSTYTGRGTSVSRYLTHVGKQTWSMAETTCETEGGAGTHLLVLSDAAEVAAFSMATDAVWIGVDDLAMAGRFVTVIGGAPPTSGWAMGEPNNIGTEDCVIILAGGASWNNVTCGLQHDFVCECDGHPVVALP